ncbi:MAG: helix-turn-helix domain-containing protein, partial [Oscillospiraceae bacterium]|nr:helix-turn-helix domain-containing protein [Oscillospiraceae bacterium]
MNKTVINLRLSELRRANHITQNELAEKIGTTFQTISKWENGITMPDITVLPVLADYFGISVDELLGLKPLKDDVYSYEGTDSQEFWDNHFEYISRSRNESWNNDYLGFLIREVWKIEKAVNVLDCGCGYAYFAPMIMNFLPEGSSYTGIDFSSAMSEQAEKLLKKYNINGRIIKCDFFESSFKNKFDIVMCQSVLRHIGNSKAFIGKMIDAAVGGGLIVCIDTNLELECSGLYVDGMDYGELCDHSGAI